MEKELANIFFSLDKKDEKKELQKLEKTISNFGLSLSNDEIKMLIDGRKTAIKKSGLIEISGGVTEKIIYSFCDSPYILKTDFATTIFELQDTFYYLKSNAKYDYTDDELIEKMKTAFEEFSGLSNAFLDFLTENL